MQNKCANSGIYVALLFLCQFDIKYFIVHLFLSLFFLSFYIHLFCYICFHMLYISFFLSFNLSWSSTFFSVMAIKHREPKNSKDTAAVNQNLNATYKATLRNRTKNRKSQLLDTVLPLVAKKYTLCSSPLPKTIMQ